MIELDILYEDESVVAVVKPAGLIVHADGKHDEPTVADWVRARYPSAEEVGEPLQLSNGTMVMRPGIVHRLDRETSGVLLIAKTQDGFLNLKEQFQNRTIEKEYRAFLWGVPKKREGVVDRPIGRSATDFRKWSAQRGARGTLRPAVTEYAILEDNGTHSYAAARPKTGRTHQIRVHFAALSHPVVCDRLYAPKRAPDLGFERLALHAHEIAFKTMTDERITVTAPLPPDFEEALRQLRAGSVAGVG